MKRQYLEDLRITKGLSVKHTALCLGISRQAYYDLISGKTRFPRWRFSNIICKEDIPMVILLFEQKYQQERLTSEKKSLTMESRLTEKVPQSNNKR